MAPSLPLKLRWRSLKAPSFRGMTPGHQDEEAGAVTVGTLDDFLKGHVISEPSPGRACTFSRKERASRCAKPRVALLLDKHPMMPAAICPQLRQTCNTGASTLCIQYVESVEWRDGTPPVCVRLKQCVAAGKARGNKTNGKRISREIARFGSNGRCTRHQCVENTVALT